MILEVNVFSTEPLGISDATSSLCSTLEAIFLHGLKDSFLQMTFSILDEVDRRPNPNFWSIVLLFLHKEVIQEIQSLSQVTTDVGYSRAFVRKAVNECLLSSYFQNIRKSASTLKSYYHRYAFLYDAELVETIENLLMGIESYVEFDLPCNSSLLNAWNDAPLQMSGLYSAPLRSLPIASGEDVAGSLICGVSSSQNIKIPNRVTVLSDIYSASISNSIFTNSPGSIVDEDDQIPRLLKKIDCDDVEEVTEERRRDDYTLVATVDSMFFMKDEPTFHDPNESSIEPLKGNSISGVQSWSEPAQGQSEEQPEAEPIVFNRSSSIKSVMVDNQSFESLWNEKQRRSNYNFKEVWERFEKSLNSFQPETPTDDEDVPEGFEVVQLLLKDKSAVQQLQEMVEILCRLTTEGGLDSQGFLCKECKAPLGVDFSKATVCGFDSHYYCLSCISTDKYPIPSKIIYNWDFKNYSVSKNAAIFLTDYQFKPFIDFKVNFSDSHLIDSVEINSFSFQLLNPDIYSYIDEMNRLQKLRIQLNFIRAYIFTCSESTISELQKLLYGKEYVYESIHLYSTSDLSLIQSGALEEMLKRIVSFGKGHCLKCVLCSVKGFICEYCRKPKVIYPFDVDETYRCNTCGSVSHINCYDPSISCPKCDRKLKRQLTAAENQ